MLHPGLEQYAADKKENEQHGWILICKAACTSSSEKKEHPAKKKVLPDSTF